jgi:hypothetical protein
MGGTMNTIKISASFWDDHEERLWYGDCDNLQPNECMHIDGVMRCTVMARNSKQVTLQMCLDGVKELYSDASYQAEISTDDPSMRAYGAMAKRVMEAIRKQVELPEGFLRTWALR